MACSHSDRLDKDSNQAARTDLLKKRKNAFNEKYKASFVFNRKSNENTPEAEKHIFAQYE